MPKYSRFDLASIIIIVLILIFSLIRFYELPQWIDAYYHLSVANGFIESGGWIGQDWWSFAPAGRPHVYPPLYHLILVLLMKMGIGGLNAIRLLEVSILPLAFFGLWYTLRALYNPRFSFFSLLTLSGFFPFYTAVSANGPASMAIILGLFAWFFIRFKRPLSAAISLALSFYMHGGMPWIFLISILMLALLYREYRGICLFVSGVSLVAAIPLLYHYLHNINEISFQVMGEAMYVSYSLFIMVFGILSLVLFSREKGLFIPLFWGYTLGSIIVLARYPYRLFSAQGIMGLGLLSATLVENTLNRLSYKKAISIGALIVIYLAFFGSAFNLNGGYSKFNLRDSTYYNITSGKAYEHSNFRGFILRDFMPLKALIEDRTMPTDIIASNAAVASGVLGAISGRPTTNSLFWEVRPKGKERYLADSKLIFWIKGVESDIIERIDQKWELIHEDDFAYVFLNPHYKGGIVRRRASLRFSHIGLILLGLFATIVYARVAHK